jgi:hypothetical protein
VKFLSDMDWITPIIIRAAEVSYLLRCCQPSPVPIRAPAGRDRGTVRD